MHALTATSPASSGPCGPSVLLLGLSLRLLPHLGKWPHALHLVVSHSSSEFGLNLPSSAMCSLTASLVQPSPESGFIDPCMSSTSLSMQFTMCHVCPQGEGKGKSCSMCKVPTPVPGVQELLRKCIFHELAKYMYFLPPNRLFITQH